jgi:hypothetical protein
MARETMQSLREMQVAFSQLQGATKFSSDLDSSLKKLETELVGEVTAAAQPSPVEAPDYAQRELDELKRELEGEGGGR